MREFMMRRSVRQPTSVSDSPSRVTVTLMRRAAATPPSVPAVTLTLTA